MRDNIVAELRFAAKKWKEDNQRILFTGEINVGQALAEAADAIEELKIPTPVRCRDGCHWARDDWGDEYTPPSMECEKDDCFESLNLDPCYGERDDVDVPDCPFYLNREQIEQMEADYHVYEPYYTMADKEET